MNALKLNITALRVEGEGKPPAEIAFRNGLTAVSGASNTGKTYIAETIDFLLGASSPPEVNPESRGYTRAFLEFRTSDGKEYSIYRGFQNNNVSLYEGPLSSINSTTQGKQLSAIHRTGARDTLSHYLLSLLSLDGKFVRRNQYAEKSELTFRNVAHLILIDEMRIISKSSPALTPNDNVNHPLERSVFSFFLTGQDDADLTSVEKPKERMARLDTEESLLRQIIEEKQARLAKLSGKDGDPTERVKRLDEAISQASQLISVAKEQIQALEQERKTTWEQLQKDRSRRMLIAEQLNRLNLLQEFYRTDRNRLEAIAEAGMAFEHLPGGQCAVCGSKPVDHGDTGGLGGALSVFQNACNEEVIKIEKLSQDLTEVIAEMKAEDAQLHSAIDKGRLELAKVNDKLEQIVRPQSVSAEVGMNELIRMQSTFSKAVDVQMEIAQLNQRVAKIEAARKLKPIKSPAAQLGTATAAKFCQVVQETLTAWKFPFHGNVSFDGNQRVFDITLGDQNRRSLGKGYRAVTHAAFTVALMRYCRLEGVPHPGFVVLDTPLNPFKGSDMGSEVERVNEDVKTAFYEDLANDKSGDQFIVLENEEPGKDIRSKILYHHFSKNSNVGRYGFFPISQNNQTG